MGQIAVAAACWLVGEIGKAVVLECPYCRRELVCEVDLVEGSMLGIEFDGSMAPEAGCC